MKDKSVKSLGAIILSFIFFLPLSMYQGWVFNVLWKWFLVPFGLPVFNLWQSIGIMIVLSYATKSTNLKNDQDAFDHFIESLSISLFRPATILISGWIIHFFL